MSRMESLSQRVMNSAWFAKEAFVNFRQTQTAMLWLRTQLALHLSIVSSARITMNVKNAQGITPLIGETNARDYNIFKL